MSENTSSPSSRFRQASSPTSKGGEASSPVRTGSYRERRQQNQRSAVSGQGGDSSDDESSASDSTDEDEAKSERKRRDVGGAQAQQRKLQQQDHPLAVSFAAMSGLNSDSAAVAAALASPRSIPDDNDEVLLSEEYELGLPVEENDATKTAVCFGDVVLIKHVTVAGCVDGCMMAEGMVLDTLCVAEGGAESALESNNSLFRVCPALSYDAMIALEDLEKIIEDNGEMTGELTEQLLECRHEALRERHQNNSRLDSVKKGLNNGPIAYDETYLQLQHLPSGKFVTAKPHPYSKGSAHLQGSFGSPESLFKVKPRYHFRTDGDDVMYSDELYLESVTNLGYCLRLDRDAQAVQGVRTSGKPISFESTTGADLKGWERFGKQAFGAQLRLHPLTMKGAWAFRRFSTTSEAGGKGGAPGEVDAVIYVQKALYFFHLEEHGYLQIPVDSANGAPAMEDAERALAKRPQLFHKGLRDVRQGIIVPHSMWTLESVDCVQGGAAVEGVPYRIRHTHTRRYLTVDYSNVNPHAAPPKRMLVTSSPVVSDENIFYFRSTHRSAAAEAQGGKGAAAAVASGAAQTLKDECKCWIEHIHRGSSDIVYRLQSIPGHGLFVSPALHNADAFVLRAAEISEEALQLSSMELSAIATKCAKAASLNDAKVLSDVRCMLATIVSLCAGSRSYDATEGDDSGSNGAAAGKAAPASVELGFDIRKEYAVFQNIARESGLVAALFNLAVRGRAELKERGAHEELEKVQNSIYSALEKLVRGCRPSQAYFVKKEFDAEAEENRRSTSSSSSSRSYQRMSAHLSSSREPTTSLRLQKRWIDFVLQQAGPFPAAAILLNALIEDNEELLIQEKYGRYVDQDVINQLIALIRWQGPQPRFLDFFRRVCSCRGEKIVPNQELLVNHLYVKPSNRRELFIETIIPVKISDALFRWQPAPPATHKKVKVPKAFLARSQFENGFRPVYIKWFSSENWRPNQSALYHSPRALHLVDRHGNNYERDVLLQRAAWVLDPKRLFKAVMFEGLNILKSSTSSKKPRGSLSPSRSARAIPTGLASTVEDTEKLRRREERRCQPVRAMEYEEKDLWWYDPEVQNILNRGCVEELPDEAKEHFRRQRQLVRYYVVQLNLFADMAMERSYNAIQQLEEELRYDVLLSMIANDLLPDAIRAAATTLVLRVYVDRYPHQSLQTPQCVHVMSAVAPISELNLENSKMEVLPCYQVTPEMISDDVVDEDKELRMEFLRFGLKPNERPADKFFLLQDFISKHLGATISQNPAEIESNKFTLSIVNVFMKLLELGFYANYYRLVDVVDKAVGVLNGKVDDPGIEDPLAALESKADGIIPRHRVETAGDRIVVKCKQNIITALIIVSSLRDDYRLKLLMAKFVEHNGGASLDGGFEEAKSSSEPKPAGKIESPRSSEPLVEDGKLTEEFYDIFHAIFESGDDESGLNFTLKGHQLDLDEMSPQSKMVPMCMDLMMYDSPELFEAAFSLLHAQFTQRTPLVTAMQNVEILETYNILPKKPDCDLGSIKLRVQHLRRLVESYEVWAVSNSFSSDNDGNHTRLVELCMHLVDFCMHDHRNGTLSTDEVMRSGWPMERRSQSILRSLGLHECLIEAITIPFGQYPAGKSRQMLQHTVNMAFETLAAFVLNNQTNQDVVTANGGFDNILRLLENAEQTGPIECVLGPLIYNNTSFVDSIEDVTLERLSGLLARRPLNSPHLLAFFVQLTCLMTSGSKRHSFTMALVRQPLLQASNVAADQDERISAVAAGSNARGPQQQKEDVDTLLTYVDSCLEENPLEEPFDLDKELELKLRNCARVLELLANSAYPPKIWKCYETAADFQPLSKPHISYARNLRALSRFTKPEGLMGLIIAVEKLLHAPSHAVQISTPAKSSATSPSRSSSNHASPRVQRHKVLGELLNACHRLFTVLYLFVDDEVRVDLFGNIDSWQMIRTSVLNGFDIMDEARDETNLVTTVIPMVHAFLLKSRGTIARFERQAAKGKSATINLVVECRDELMSLSMGKLGSRGHSHVTTLAKVVVETIDPNSPTSSSVQVRAAEAVSTSKAQTSGSEVAWKGRKSMAPAMVWREELSTSMTEAVSSHSKARKWFELVQCCDGDEKLLHLSDENEDKLRDRMVDQLGPSHGNFQKATDLKSLVFEIQRRGTTAFRYRPTSRDLVRKMVRHVIENFTCEIESGFDTKSVNVEILYILVSMLDEWIPTQSHTEGSMYDEELKEFRAMQVFMDNCGAMELVIYAISVAKDESVIIASLRLGINLLLFGNKDVQASLLRLCQRTEAQHSHTTEMFFLVLQRHFVSAKECSRSGRARPSGGKRQDGREEVEVIIPVLEFLQSAMEGHYRGMQNQIREQPSLHADVNLLDEALELIGELSEPHRLRLLKQRMRDDEKGKDLDVFISVLRFATETMQGPCRKNQRHFIGKSQALSAVKRIMLFVIDKELEGYEEKQHELFEAICTLVHAAVEIGVEERLSRTIINYFDSATITEAIIYVYSEVETLSGSDTRSKKRNTTFGHVSMREFFCGRKENVDVKSREEKLLYAGYNLYSFAKQLSIYQPSLLEPPLGFTDIELAERANRFLQERVGRLEFVWKEGDLGDSDSKGSGSIHVLYFLRPPEIAALSSNNEDDISMDNYQDLIEVNSLELLQKDFLELAQSLVDEMCHLYELSSKPIYTAMSKRVPNIRKFGFIAVVFLNLIFLFCVEGEGGNGKAKGFLLPTADKQFTINFHTPAMRGLYWMFWMLGCIAYLICFSMSLSERLPLIVDSLKRERRNARYERVHKGSGASSLDGKLHESTQVWATYEADEEEDDDDNDEGSNEVTKRQQKTKYNSVVPVTAAAAPSFSFSSSFSSSFGSFSADRKRAPSSSSFITSRIMKFTVSARGVHFSGMDENHPLVLDGVEDIIYLFLLVFMVALIISVKYDNERQTVGAVLAFGGVLVLLLILMRLPDIFKNVEDGFMFTYCAVTQALLEPNTLLPFIWLSLLLLHRIGYDFYLAALCLLDVITLSPRLQNVLRAVTVPFYDFVSIFALMILTVFIFAAWGLYVFGQIIVYEPDDEVKWKLNDDDAQNGATIYIDDGQQPSYCVNLLECWLEMFDEGLRTGDIVDAAFDTVTFEDDNMQPYINRVFYGLAFFLCVGVILFDIVTGIVVDTFAQLRESTDKKMEYHKTTAFISGITRSEYEEYGLDFDDLCQDEQCVWNYVHFMCYLRKKNHTEYNGAESMINAQIECQDISWLPKKNTVAMQKKGAINKYDEQEAMKDELIESLGRKLESVERALKSCIETTAREHDAALHDAQQGARRGSEAGTPTPVNSNNNDGESLWGGLRTAGRLL